MNMEFSITPYKVEGCGSGMLIYLVDKTGGYGGQKVKTLRKGWTNGWTKGFLGLDKKIFFQ